MAEPPLTALGEAFLEELRALKRSEKVAINALSMLAQDNPEEAAQLVSIMDKHLGQCQLANRLSVLHLADSILRNAAGPYIPLLAAKIPKMFTFVWDGADAGLKASLQKLANFWVNVLPQDTLAAINMHIKASQAAAAAAPLPRPGHPAGTAPRPVVPHASGIAGLPPRAVAPPQPSAVSLLAPAARAPLPPQAFLPSAPNSLPLASAAPLPLAPPLLQQQHRPSPPLQSMPELTSFSFPVPPPRPQYYGVDPRLMPAATSLRPPLQKPPPPPAVAHAVDPRLSMVVPGSTPSPPLLLNGNIVASSSAVVSTGYPVQGSSLGGVVHAQTTAVTGLSMFAPAVAQLPPPPAGSLFAAVATPFNAGVGTASPSRHVGTSQPTPPPRSTAFTPSTIKDFDASAVDELLAASEGSRSRFMDMAFHRSRRLRSSAAASRQWYVTSDRWLTGTTTAPVEEATGFFEDASVKPSTPVRYFVPEDPSQPECAISGERFERTYDADADEWQYEDAVILFDDEAAQYGVMNGSIVKVQCLAGGPSQSAAALRHAASLSLPDTPALPPQGVTRSSAAASTSASGPASPPPATTYKAPGTPPGTPPQQQQQRVDDDSRKRGHEVAFPTGTVANGPSGASDGLHADKRVAVGLSGLPLAGVYVKPEPQDMYSGAAAAPHHHAAMHQQQPMLVKSEFHGR